MQAVFEPPLVVILLVEEVLWGGTEVCLELCSLALDVDGVEDLVTSHGISKAGLRPL